MKRIALADLHPDPELDALLGSFARPRRAALREHYGKGSGAKGAKGEGPLRHEPRAKGLTPGSTVQTAIGPVVVPPKYAPGEAPLEPGVVRAYHYTDNLDAVMKSGLSTEFAKGETYGEPNMLWFSAEKPGNWKEYIEVHVKPLEMGVGGPWNTAEAAKWGTKEAADFMARGSNFTLAGTTLPPERIVTHQKLWHPQYRSLMERYPPDAKSYTLGSKDEVARLFGTGPNVKRPEMREAVALWLHQMGKGHLMTLEESLAGRVQAAPP